MKAYGSAEERESAKKQSRTKYKAEKISQVLFQFINDVDADILGHLDAQPSKINYIRRVIREDIKKTAAH